ncbi:MULTISPECIES: Cof-type HAD-IIB family hydrolase [Enterococcus]|uniref:Cof-type HAD-IIB family hydrolase n=1 Tax=Enterococcus alishanensis TaxID=1303817 RepID=A0ABS6TI56_9ENTE|nr:Cof-type HAD-IIB family hydrolase [Enterococcus alishanensis]MBV7392454.1 Cof-type HAD-IIB family hydrolase [Enterococcus alishanensis]
MKKLIAIDLDGTTLNQDSIITEKTFKTLRRAVEDGHQVVIATGRPYRMSQQFYHQLKLTSPMINFNGALVHLPGKQWKGEQETAINRKIVFDLLAEKKNLKLDFIAAENRNTFFIDDLNFFDKGLFASEQATLDNLLTTDTLTSNPTSMLLRSQPENLVSVSNELKNQFGQEIEVNTWGGPSSILEVVAKGIQKAHGLERVIDEFQMDKKDIIAFGDEHNDVDMLQYAGWGVAMANGTDQVKSVANDITDKPNSEDGLADYLTKYLDL